MIAQAFDIKSDFTINAIHRCPSTGREQLQAIWSDWDLDASIQTVQPGSYLRLRYELSTRAADEEEGLYEIFLLNIQIYRLFLFYYFRT